MEVAEMREIAVSVVAIALAFTIGKYRVDGLVSTEFWIMFVITLVTVGLGFVLHELAHRQVAKGYGA
ncbi:MAG: site-2 protease family protein, partial [Candidatus Micrarchaeota archaeon]